MKHSKLKLNSNTISLAGEFAVLSQLALRGYDANMTLGRTKSVDILVAHQKTGKMYQLEVKTGVKNIRKKPITSRLWGNFVADWIMSAKHERIKNHNLFYCFVSIHEKTHEFRFFIVPSHFVAKYIKEENARWRKGRGRRTFNDMRTFRIGLKGEKYTPEMATVEKYENNWSFNQ